MLPFVRGVDLSGNDFKVSCGEREGRPLGRLSGPLPLRFRDRRAGRAGLPRVFPGLPRPGRKTWAGAPGVWGRAGSEPSGREPDPMPPREHALASHRPTLWSRNVTSPLANLGFSPVLGA